MAYIGTSPSNGVRRVHTYTATANQTTFTGSSTEGVTLTYADTNYIDVFQNGVLLGSADYTSTSGTSVVLAQGASVSDLVVIVVYDVFSVADTVSKTSGGSFDSGVTVNGNVVSNDGSNNARFQFDNNNQILIQNDTAMNFYVNGSNSLKIDSTGAVTKPLQPAFHIIPDQMNNIANNGTITFGTEIFDIGSNFASNTFTAPVTGKYQICVQIGLTTIDSAASFIGLDVHTSNRHYYVLYDPDFGQDNIYWELAFSGLVDMDADDTIVLKFLQNGGTTQTEIEDAHSNFSGYLVA